MKHTYIHTITVHTYIHTADHTYSKCLAQRLNDTGSGHSPVYGFASDGFPVYGPYQAANQTLTVSCWQTRNYSNPVIGCKGGERTCLLKNNLLPYGGTTVAAYPGPPLNGTILTQSSNVINSSSGIYYQDYYYNSSCTSVNISHLDQFNGHNHGDNCNIHRKSIVDIFACMHVCRICCRHSYIHYLNVLAYIHTYIYSR